MDTLRKYGSPPYQIALLHGGPGAAGEMRPVAEHLAKKHGILEPFQTKKTIDGQVEELYSQLIASATLPVTLIGYSWGAWLGTIFAGRYPDCVKKLILISAGAYDSRYNSGLLEVRMSRLTEQERKEAGSLLLKMNNGSSIQADIFKRFGELMSKADCYECIASRQEPVVLNPEIYQSVWKEASAYRDSGKLLTDAATIACEVVAFHGAYDSHPLAGVEIPLSATISNFRMLRLEHCGHTPWKEKQAKEAFYKLMSREL